MTWPTKSLADIAAESRGTIQTGPFGSQLHQCDYAENGIPVVMPKDIIAGRINLDGIAKVPTQKANQLARHTLHIGDIVFPRRGEINKCALVSASENGFLCGTGCLKISIPEVILDSHFLFFFLTLPSSSAWLEKHAVGSTMLNLNTQIFGDFEVPIPPLPEQRRIVGILSAYDDLIENNRKRIALLEESVRQLYREWFVRLRFPGHERTRVAGGVPKGWKLLTLGDVCKSVRVAATPKQIVPETPYIGLEHLPRRSITLSNWGAAAEVTSGKLRFRAGEIIFGKIRPYFHKVGIALVDGVASSDSIIIRPNFEALLPFVLLTVSSDDFVAATAQGMREGSKMPRADWKQMQKYPLAVPPLPVLAAFNRLLYPILDQCRTLALQSRALDVARDVLLPRLMQGGVA